MATDNKLIMYGDKEFFKNVNFLQENFNVHKPIYRYMDVDSAINFLQTRSLTFVEPSSWYDPFEKRFYNADFSQIPNYSKPKIFASCFTSKPTNEAAWVMYSYFKSGLASKSIRFEFNPTLLYHMLDEFGKMNKAKIVVSNVNYSLAEQTIKALHKTTCKHHLQYFNNFNDDKFVNLMLIKRKAFEYEKEIRIFIIPTSETPKEIVQVFDNIDKLKLVGDNIILTDLIKSIMISPNCTPLETQMIEKQIQEITQGAIKYRQSKLYSSFDPIIIEQ